jgi:hypothetical protein
MCVATNHTNPWASIQLREGGIVGCGNDSGLPIVKAQFEDHHANAKSALTYSMAG